MTKLEMQGYLIRLVFYGLIFYICYMIYSNRQSLMNVNSKINDKSVSRN